MLFISVISHGHDSTIIELDCLSKLSKVSDCYIIIKSNTPPSKQLSAYCSENDIKLLDCNYGLGFGANNNFVYDHLKNTIKCEDWFLVLNPDVYVDVEAIKQLITVSNSSGVDLATINLYKDPELRHIDPSVRLFPEFKDFLLSYLGFKNKTIVDKSVIGGPIPFDWAAGSFLLVKAKLYNQLNGFDERYFMYCEDIDFCLRAHKCFGAKTLFFPKIFGLHLAAHRNRQIFSRHFFWHLQSVLKYLMVKHRFKSAIK